MTKGETSPPSQLVVGFGCLHEEVDIFHGRSQVQRVAVPEDDLDLVDPRVEPGRPR